MKWLIVGLGVMGALIIIAFSPRAYTPIISASATLDFPSTAAGASSDLIITLTGAAANDVVMLGVDNAAITVNSTYTAWVSATNTVTVRYSNVQLLNALNPASGTFTVKIPK